MKIQDRFQKLSNLDEISAGGGTDWGGVLGACASGAIKGATDGLWGLIGGCIGDGVGNYIDQNVD